MCVIKIFEMTVDDVPAGKSTRIARLDANTNVNAAERRKRREKIGFVLGDSVGVLLRGVALVGAARAAISRSVHRGFRHSYENIAASRPTHWHVPNRLHFRLRIVRITVNFSSLEFYFSKIVCICHGINEQAMHEAVAIGACAMSDLACMTGVATCCGKCAGCAGNVLNEALGATYALPA